MATVLGNNLLSNNTRGTMMLFGLVVTHAPWLESDCVNAKIGIIPGIRYILPAHLDRKNEEPVIL